MTRRIFFLVTFFIGHLASIGQKYEPDSAVVFTDKNCKLIDYYYEDSITYSWNGECRSGWADGLGEMTKFRKGEKFSTISAQFEKGLAQSQGTYKIHTTNERYKGRFINGQMTGDGEYWNDGGDYYKGQIRNFILHGTGKMTFANGATFEGKFRDFSYWTGKFVDLQDKTIYFYRREKVDKLPKFEEYNPKLGVELTEYFNEEWERCNKKEAAFFRKVTYAAPHIPTGRVRDYYINGKIQNEFLPLYIDYEDDQMTFHGKYKTIYYYPSGVISSICFYDHQSRKSGYEYDFYESGELFSETYYGSLGLRDGPYREYYKNGDLKGYAKYSEGSRVNNSYWQISSEGSWVGVFHLDIAQEFERFEVEEECVSVFEYSDLLCIKLPSDECFYFNPELLVTGQEGSYSIEVDLVISDANKENVFGLIFNYVDANNFSVLKIAGSKVYSIVRYVSGKESSLVPWTQFYVESKEKSDDLNADVMLSFIGEELILEINGQELNRFLYEQPEEMVSGFYARGKGFFVVKKFGQIAYFDKETSENYTNFVISERDGKSAESDDSEFTGNGSGFLISKDGFIATNYHVIEGAEVIQVEFDLDGKKEKYRAEIIQVDADNDVAIIKVDLGQTELELPYSICKKLQDVGTDIFTLGYPYADVMGSEIKYTDGAVNSRTGIQGDVRFYQISAPIQPGNSGGPCLNDSGEIIGIVSARLNDEKYQNQNVNYVLKVSYLENLMALLPEGSLDQYKRINTYASRPAMIRDFKKFVPIIYTK